MQMGQARLATIPSRVLHGLGHSSTQAPGLLGVAPTKGPFNRHLLGHPSIFRPLPKPSSPSSPWSGPRPLPTTPTLVPSQVLDFFPATLLNLLTFWLEPLQFRTRPLLQILALPAPLNASSRPHQILVLFCSQNLLEGGGGSAPFPRGPQSPQPGGSHTSGTRPSGLAHCRISASVPR